MAAVGEKAVNVTWTSGNDKVIKVPNGDSRATVTHETETVNVKLTATLSYKGQTATKDFNVKVYGTAPNIKIDDADMLKSAAKYVRPRIREKKDNVTITLPTTVENNFDDPNTPKPDYSNIKITWQLLSNDANVSITNNAITATKTTKVYTVNYQATLKLNKATQTKDFTSSINKLTNRFYEGTNEGESLSIYDDYLELNNYVRYSYRTEGDFLYLTKQAGFVPISENTYQWLTPEDAKKMYKDAFNLDALLPAATALEKNPTIDNLANFLNNVKPPLQLPTKEPYELLIQMKAYKDPSIDTVEKAKAATPEVTNAAVANCVPLLKVQFASSAKMSEEEAKKTTLDSICKQSFDYIIEVMGFGTKDLEEFKAKLVEREGKATLDAVFDPNKTFEKQRGEYKYTDSTNPKTVSLRVYFTSKKNGHLEINTTSSDSGHSSYHYNVKFNDDFTKFTAIPSDESQGTPKDPVEWTLTYTKTNGNVKIASATDSTYDLKFSPECLFQSK